MSVGDQATCAGLRGSKPCMAMEQIQGGREGSIEFDESSASGTVESRLSILRTLVEDIAHTGEGRFTKEIMVDDKVWRVVVEPAG